MATKFPPAWWSFDLGDHRPCDGTYELYPYDSIPPVDTSLFRGTFQWLGQPSDEPDDLSTFRANAEGLALPPAFLRFMADRDLRNTVPSVTACEWDLGGAPIPCRVVEGASTIRFLRDQQDCLFWYLHVVPGAEPVVLCSPIPFDDPDLDVPAEVVLENTWVVAPDFETFVYRFWLENVLWEKVHDRAAEFEPAEAAYLAHYRPVS